MISSLLRKMDHMEEERDKIIIEMLKGIELKTKEMKKLKLVCCSLIVDGFFVFYFFIFC